MYRTILRYGLPLLGLLTLAGCSRVTALQGPRRDLRTLYKTSLTEARPTLAMQPYHSASQDEDPTPTLMQPPRIQKVWIPTQRTLEGDFIAGHWTYLLLEAPQWQLEAPPTAVRLPLPPLPMVTPSSSQPRAPITSSIPRSPTSAPGSAPAQSIPVPYVSPTLLPGGDGTGLPLSGTLPELRYPPVPSPWPPHQRETP
jgi:hypothetical protein